MSSKAHPLLGRSDSRGSDSSLRNLLLGIVLGVLLTQTFHVARDGQTGSGGGGAAAVCSPTPPAPPPAAGAAAAALADASSQCSAAAAAAAAGWAQGIGFELQHHDGRPGDCQTDARWKVLSSASVKRSGLHTPDCSKNDGLTHRLLFVTVRLGQVGLLATPRSCRQASGSKPSAHPSSQGARCRLTIPGCAACSRARAWRRGWYSIMVRQYPTCLDGLGWVAAGWTTKPACVHAHCLHARGSGQHCAPCCSDS
jgi:hypothetical protein